MAVRDNVKKKSKETEEVKVEEKRSLRQSVQDASAYSRKAPEEKFRTLKMWVTYLVSLTTKDRGKIPDNIGNRVLIGNNIYITKLYMNSIIRIIEFGKFTPQTFLMVLNERLRLKGNKAILDMSIKNRKYIFNPKKTGVQARKALWQKNVENVSEDDDSKTKYIAERSSRLLYTLSLAESGVQLKYSRIYLTLRAKDINTLMAAERIIYSTLDEMECDYKPVFGDIKATLELISLIGNTFTELESHAPMMTNNHMLADLAPNSGSYNDKDGLYLGQNIENGSPYYLNVDGITGARNMYIVAPSGEGKGVLALNMAQSAYERGSAVCCMDIKGNEYVTFVKATGGYIVSLRATSIEYINSWVMHKEDVTQENAESYFKNRINFSKQQMIILSGIKDEAIITELNELLEEFHDALYVSIGAVPSNINSWDVTESLNPYEVFRRFEIYLTPSKMAEYNISKTTIGVLRMYMSESGSKSYIFKQEFDYGKILRAPTLSFDFGILSKTNQSDVDKDLFRLKFLYMNELNGDFVTRKYAEGKRTFKILEECQVVSPEIMKMYVEEYTLRRSQNQDTLLIGNSIEAIKNNDFAKPIIENTRGLFIGKLTTDARDEVIAQFGLKHLEKLMMKPGSLPKYKNSFLFVNLMQDRTLYPIIKVVMNPKLEEEYGKKTYKILVPVKEESALSGGYE